jgi:CubicO group peptidase (beta-lactamase class C family)
MPAGAVDILRRAVAEGATPGWALAAGLRDTVEVMETGGPGIAADTLFDIASLTKVVATLPIALALIDEATIALDTTVGPRLPAFAHPQITVEQLLTHTSGLPSDRPYGRQGLSAETIRSRLEAEPLDHPSGTHVQYSDIGFITLGWLLESAAGTSLDILLDRYVTGPLQLPDTGYGPVDAGRAAPTEHGLRGTVHDETAARLRSPTGHAGVFSTVGDLAAYLTAWTADGWLSRSLRDQATADRTAHLDGHRGLGWTARGDPYDQLGDAWPPTAVFHSGFTGTSLALDPPSGLWVVLLTNDVHFGRGRGAIKPLRRAVHDALAPPSR